MSFYNNNHVYMYAYVFIKTYVVFDTYYILHEMKLFTQFVFCKPRDFFLD